MSQRTDSGIIDRKASTKSPGIICKARGRRHCSSPSGKAVKQT